MESSEQEYGTEDTEGARACSLLRALCASVVNRK